MQGFMVYWGDTALTNLYTWGGFSWRWVRCHEHEEEEVVKCEGVEECLKRGIFGAMLRMSVLKHPDTSGGVAHFRQWMAGAQFEGKKKYCPRSAFCSVSELLDIACEGKWQKRLYPSGVLSAAWVVVGFDGAPQQECKDCRHRARRGRRAWS